MRRLLIAGLAMVSPSVAAAPPPETEPARAEFQPPIAEQAPDNCPRTTSYHALDWDQAAKPRKLTELPPANQYAAVYRHIGGCEVPLVVRYNVGG